MGQKKKKCNFTIIAVIVTWLLPDGEKSPPRVCCGRNTPAALGFCRRAYAYGAADSAQYARNSRPTERLARETENEKKKKTQRPVRRTLRPSER